jgi:hypothetical protein
MKLCQARVMAHSRPRLHCRLLPSRFAKSPTIGISSNKCAIFCMAYEPEPAGTESERLSAVRDELRVLSEGSATWTMCFASMSACSLHGADDPLPSQSRVWQTTRARQLPPGVSPSSKRFRERWRACVRICRTSRSMSRLVRRTPAPRRDRNPSRCLTAARAERRARSRRTSSGGHSSGEHAMRALLASRG